MADRRPIPLAVDLVALTVVLLGLTWWVGTDVSYSIDEPAAVLQAQRLEAGEGWIFPNPLPTVDPAAQHFYLVLSDRGSRGVAPYAKHPAYPVVLAIAQRVGGQTAMVLLSVAGAVAAAYVAAAMARRIDPHLGRATLWAAGVGSPLLFDSQLVIAHTVGAALAGGGQLVLLGLAERWQPARVAATGGLLAAACFLRTEGVLLALVLGGWAVWRARRAPAGERYRWMASALTWWAAGGGALLLDRWLLARIVGGGVSGVTTLADRDLAGFLGTRPGALTTMVLAPGEAWPPGAQLALLVVLAGGLGLGLLVRGHHPPVPVLVAVAVVMTVAAVAPVLAGVPATVPGLLIACPVVTVGLVTLRPVVVAAGPARTLAGIALAYAAAVAATQYAQAGGVEWGARYLVLALPAMLAVAVASLAAALRPLGTAPTRVVVAGLAAVSVALAGLAAWSLQRTHVLTRAFAGRIAEAAAQAGGPDLGDGDRRPVVVATWFAVGRLTTGPGPAVRGLTVNSGADLAAVADGLRRAGVDRFVLVSAEDADVGTLAPRYRVGAVTGDARVKVMVAGA